MKYLILSSLVFISLSCSKPYQSFLKDNPGRNISAAEIDKIFSSKEIISTKYIARVSAMGKEFSGIFILRQTDPDSFRVILLAHTGVTLLTMQITQDNYKVLFAFEQINRKAFLDMFYNDIYSLLFLDRSIVSSLFIDNEGKYDVIKLINKAGTHYCYIDRESGRLNYIEEVDEDKVMKKIVMEKGADNTLKAINIEHFDFKIQIALEKFDDE